VEGRVEDDGWGRRFLADTYADAYLQRSCPQPGYAVVVFRGSRHVAGPCDLTDDETVGYWRAIRAAVRAIQDVFEPCHVNYQQLGNSVPHLHTHVLPRYDPAPEHMLGETTWKHSTQDSSEDFETQLRALRRAIERP
jgi:diadenosine tetraphosphate (Ap4A) HIT family hydrolase